MTNACGAILFGVILAYAIFGGADFGAGFWDLTAGGAEAGRRPRGLVDRSIGPVWEANHVWLIFALVVAWTAFPTAFASVMRTLYVPLGLAALGIVLRGSGFAFRKVAVRTSTQRVSGATFAASSVVTPFFFGAAAGAIASGRVPVGVATGPLSVWTTPASLFTGVMAVLICAYLAAVFLTAEARKRGAGDLEIYFRVRAFLSAGAAGLVAVVGLFLVRADARHLFDRLVGPALPFVLVSVAAGLAVLALIRRADPRVLRALAALTVAALVAGWAVAQYPYLLGDHLTMAAAVGPRATQVSVLVVFVVATLLIVPSLGWLYALHEGGSLEGA